MAYVNRTIKQRLKEDKTFGVGGITAWTKKDLKRSIGSSSFDWSLIDYDPEQNLATVEVTIEDTFNFNPGNRGFLAERLTTIGQKANLAEFEIEVRYTYEVKIQLEAFE